MTEASRTRTPTGRPRRPDSLVTGTGPSVVSASPAYKDLVRAMADSVVEYHAWRHGVEMVSHVNYSLQRRVQRQRRQARTDATVRG